MVRDLNIPESSIFGQFCFHPKFLEDQVDRSLDNLGLTTLDQLYLHNPEQLLNFMSFKELKPILEVREYIT